MSEVVLNNNRAVAIRRKRGSTVTFRNQSGASIFVDSDPQRLNAAAVGTNPAGTEILNATSLQISDYPGLYYARGINVNQALEVQP